MNVYWGLERSDEFNEVVEFKYQVVFQLYTKLPIEILRKIVQDFIGTPSLTELGTMCCMNGTHLNIQTLFTCDATKRIFLQNASSPHIAVVDIASGTSLAFLEGPECMVDAEVASVASNHNGVILSLRSRSNDLPFAHPLLCWTLPTLPPAGVGPVSGYEPPMVPCRVVEVPRSCIGLLTLADMVSDCGKAFYGDSRGRVYSFAAHTGGLPPEHSRQAVIACKTPTLSHASKVTSLLLISRDTDQLLLTGSAAGDVRAWSTDLAPRGAAALQLGSTSWEWVTALVHGGDLVYVAVGRCIKALLVTKGDTPLSVAFSTNLVCRMYTSIKELWMWNGRLVVHGSDSSVKVWERFSSFGLKYVMTVDVAPKGEKLCQVSVQGSTLFLRSSYGIQCHPNPNCGSAFVSCEILGNVHFCGGKMFAMQRQQVDTPQLQCRLVVFRS